MATRLGVADDKTIRFLGGGVEPIASMFDQRSPRWQKQEGESKGWKKGTTADSSSVDKGRAGVFDCRPLPRQSVVVQSRQGFSGGLFTFRGWARQRSHQMEAENRPFSDTSFNLQQPPKSPFASFSPKINRPRAPLDEVT